MKIMKNFLSEDNFKAIEQVIYNPVSDFCWFLSQGIHHMHDGFSQMTHTFYQKELNPSICSNYYHLIVPILKILNPKKLYRIRANLLFKTHMPIEHGYHTDYSDCTTSILYINTNNGYTKFNKSQEKTISERNKMISFDSNLEHTGSTCTDQPYRIVINFNYVI